MPHQVLPFNKHNKTLQATCHIRCYPSLQQTHNKTLQATSRIRCYLHSAHTKPGQAIANWFTLLSHDNIQKYKSLTQVLGLTMKDSQQKDGTWHICSSSNIH
ncbi:hypothetical protein BsWGS_11194 [Bradybaena similaris]